MFVHIPKTGGTSVRQGKQLAGPAMFYPGVGWERHPSFAVMRNPFDRIESCWRDFRYLRNMTNLDLEAFIDIFSEDCIYVKDPKTLYHHAVPMTHPVHGLQYAKTILDFENLQEGFDNFCDRNGITKTVLPKFRSSDKVPRAVWTPIARKLVEERYIKDFEKGDELGFHW